MGIKTRFNPMGGKISGEPQDLGDLSLWRYSNDVIIGKTLLYNYTGEWYNSEITQMRLNAFYNISSYFPRNCAYLPSGTTVKAGLQLYTNDGQQTNVTILSVINTNAFISNRYPNGYTSSSVRYVRNASTPSTYDVTTNVQIVNYNDPITLYVPKAGGKAVINNWVTAGTSGTTDANRNTPFYNNRDVKTVDFQKVPFVDNNMSSAFSQAFNLTTVLNIPHTVTNANYVFSNCINLNYNIQLPSNLENMIYAFNGCSNLNQNIQIPSSVLNMYYAFNNCTNLNQNIQIPSSVLNMSYAFSNCNRLNQNIFISNGVLSALGAFRNCTNLNQNIQFPDTIKYMNSVFSGCTKLNYNIKVSNNASSLGYAFNYCYTLNQNIRIPESVTNMVYAFNYCYNLNYNIKIPQGAAVMGAFCCCYKLNQNIQLPETVTNLESTFSYCYSLRQNIKVPDNVINMYYTFNGCSSLIHNINVPDTVTNMVNTFANCNSVVLGISNNPLLTNLTGTYYNCKWLNCNIRIPNNVQNMTNTFYNCCNFNSWVNIISPNVQDATYCFNVNSISTSIIPNVFIISRNVDNTLTATYNALNAAGWTWSDASIVGTAPNRVRCWSLGWSNYSNTYPNGTHVFLNVWHGKMDTFLNNNTVVTDVKVPEYLTLGSDPLNWEYPTVLHRTTFDRNAKITSVDIGTEIPWVSNQLGWFTNSNSYGGAFNTCTNLTNIVGVINSQVTQMPIAFYHSYNLKNMDLILPEGITTMRAGITLGSQMCNMPPLPSTVTNMLYCSLSTDYGIPVIPPKVTIVANGAFYNAQNSVGNIFWLSPVTSNFSYWMANYNSSLRKNVHLYFKYSNGTNTATYNLFKSSATYKGTSGNGATVDPMYNSTSNFYVYNLSNKFSTVWSSSSGTTSTALLKYNDTINAPHMAVFAQYPDWNVTSIGNICFAYCPKLRTLALYDKPWNSTSLASVFIGCYNLRVIQGLNLTGVTNLFSAFASCTNLRVMRNIPSSVTNMASTFSQCYNFNFNVQILGNSVTNMVNTFYGCFNLNQNIKIPNSVTNMVSTFQSCYNLNQNIQIPNSVTNMANTFYYCYNLNQNIKIPNSVTSMAGTFSYCYNLNQNIQIPNSVTSMAGTFYSCYNLNQNIQIPNNVKDMANTFNSCSKLQGRINVLTTELINSYHTFYGSSLVRDVYIYFRYANGEYTKTYNLVVASTDVNYKWDGQNGVIVHNLGTAAW